MPFKIAIIIIGIGCLWYSFNIFKEGWSYLYGFPISINVGWLFAIFGIILIFYGCFRKGSNLKDEEKHLICFNCKRIFFKKDVHSGQCLDCGSKLEYLDGFYERHPELKEK